MISVLLALVACSRDRAGADRLFVPLVDSSTVPDPGVDPVTDPIGDPGETRAVHDRDLLGAERAAIRAATREVRVAMFVAYDGSPVSELVGDLQEAASRGVAVRFLADEEGDETAAIVASLADAGVDAKLDHPGVTLHNKLVVADDVAVVGSHNWTWSALEANHEGSVLVADAEVASWYAGWFDAVWEAPGAFPDVALLAREDLQPLADRAVVPALLACLDDADVAVDVVMYAVTWDDAYPGGSVDRVLAAVEAAHARGVAVRVVVDSSEWIVDNGINDAAIARLRAAGVPVWTAPPSITTHAKVLRCDDVVIVGDTNWTYTGLDLVHGTSLRSSEAGVVSGTLGWMDEVRASSTPVP